MKWDELATANQDPERAYIVFLDGVGEEMPRVMPLVDGEYYIGRAQRQNIFVNFLAHSHPKKHAVWLPVPPGPSTIIPVGRIKVSNNFVQVMAGWAGHDPRERIEISLHKGAIFRATQKLHNRVNLKGFEAIHFMGEPGVKIWYIPAMSQLDFSIADEILNQLEEYGLWASAAVGQELGGDYERAQLCWEQAVEACQRDRCSRLEHANVLLELARIMRYQGKDIEAARMHQSQAAKLLGLPRISYRSAGNVGFQGQPLCLTLFVRHDKQHKIAKRLRLRYYCEALGIYKSFWVGGISPREERSESFWIRGIQEAGTHSVEVTIDNPLSDGNSIEYCFRDFIRINKRRARVNVGGDAGAIVVDGPPEDMPDIHVEHDVGLVRLRIRTTDRNESVDNR